MSGPTRTAAWLLIDLLDSCRRCALLPEAEAQALEGRLLGLLHAAVTGRGGQILAAGGDELLAAFPDPLQALSAAGEVQQAVRTVAPVGEYRPAVRCALDLPGSSADDPVAIARLLQWAAGGDVLCSAGFHALPQMAGRLADRFDALPLPAHPSGDAVWRLHPHLEPLVADVQPAAPMADPEHAVTASLPSGDGPRLGLKLAGAWRWIDLTLPRRIELGRDAACDLVIGDRRVSRQHGHIDCREDGLHYADTSTNGSFVTCGGAAERFIRHDGLPLGRRGRICFGASANEAGATCIDYQLAGD